MIRQLFKVERGTIVHFLKWGVALLAFIIMLWLAFTLLMRPGVARTMDGPQASWRTGGVNLVPTRLSPLTPITREYVRRPQIAWLQPQWGDLGWHGGATTSVTYRF